MRHYLYKDNEKAFDYHSVQLVLTIESHMIGSVKLCWHSRINRTIICDNLLMFVNEK